MVANVTHPKVLVIDDENLFRDMLGTVLGQEYDVLAADSTDAGLRLLEANHPDAVLLDLIMPGKDGIQGLKAIRKIDPNVAVIIVTGYAKLESAEQAIALGANAYVEKPVEPETLLQTLRSSVEQTRNRKREARIMEEMRGMLVELSRERTREKTLAAQAEAATDLMFDLKQPLTAVASQLKKLESQLRLVAEKHDDQAKKNLASLALAGHAVERCRELTAMCRDLSREEDIKLSEIAVPELMATIVDEVTPWAASADVKLDFRMYAKTANLRGQRVQLHRALKNLVGNAVDSTAAYGGVVRIFVSAQVDKVEIRVEDHGTGYSLDQLAQILGSRFNPVAVRKGSGLGLALSRKIIEDHGGKLKVQTAEGKGCVVFVTLPVID